MIAETTDLPTKFIKIVVTDDQGRYVLPDLPKANYDIWVRGYGLVDSPKMKAAPGKTLDLKAVVAPNDAEAAQYYPAHYWYSMLEIPAKNLFPGTGPNGNGMPAKLKSQGQWLAILKTDGCNSCHQLGDKATRTIPPALGTFRELRRGLGAPPAGRAGGRKHDGRYRRARHAARARAFRATGPIASPTASCQDRTVAAAGRRAQHRRHAVGLGRRQDLSA